MNKRAKEYALEAKDYINRGDEFYRKAAEKMHASIEAGASEREVATTVGMSKTWVHDIVTKYTSGQDLTNPWAEDTDRRRLDMAKQVLREAPLEQVESLVDALSDERKRAVAAAAGDAYLKARQDYDEEEQRKSPAQRKHEEAAASAITEAGRKAAGSFLSLGIAGHIEQATEELHELVADGSVTPQALKVITAALRALLQEYEVACAMVGLESELEVVGQ